MRHLIRFCILLFVCVSNTHAEIYKTIDKQGRTTYTDAPPKNAPAKPVELKSLNTLPAPSTVEENHNQTNVAPPQATQEYQVNLLSPANGTVLMPEDRAITINISCNANLQGDDQFAYKLDGKTVVTSTEMNAVIEEPPRGEHLLSVDVVDADNNSLAQSNTVRILVSRPSIKQKPVTVPRRQQ
jgi:hypothetical protein